MPTISPPINFFLALKPLVFIRLSRILNLCNYKIQGKFKLTSIRSDSAARQSAGLVLHRLRSTSLSVGTHIEKKKHGAGGVLRTSSLWVAMLDHSVFSLRLISHCGQTARYVCAVIKYLNVELYPRLHNQLGYLKIKKR